MKTTREKYEADQRKAKDMKYYMENRDAFSCENLERLEFLYDNQLRELPWWWSGFRKLDWRNWASRDYHNWALKLLNIRKAQLAVARKEWLRSRYEDADDQNEQDRQAGWWK